MAIHASDKQWRYPNDIAGITSFCRMLAKLEPALAVFEATGGYEMPLYLSLDDTKFPAAPVNPRQIKDFARSTDKLAKMDALDARVIAHFEFTVQPNPTPFPIPKSLK